MVPSAGEQYNKRILSYFARPPIQFDKLNKKDECLSDKPHHFNNYFIKYSTQTVSLLQGRLHFPKYS